MNDKIHFVGEPFDGHIGENLEQNDVELENWPDSFFYTMIEGKMLWIENDE